MMRLEKKYLADIQIGIKNFTIAESDRVKKEIGFSFSTSMMCDNCMKKITIFHFHVSIVKTQRVFEAVHNVHFAFDFYFENGQLKPV